MTRAQRRRRRATRQALAAIAAGAPLRKAYRRQVEGLVAAPQANAPRTRWIQLNEILASHATGKRTHARDMQHAHYVVLDGKPQAIPIRPDRETPCYRWQRCLKLRGE